MALTSQVMGHWGICRPPPWSLSMYTNLAVSVYISLLGSSRDWWWTPHIFHTLLST